MRTTAIVLAAGKGSRMHSETPKQYMELLGKPLIYYSLRTFEDSFVDEIVLVVSPGDEDYCKEQIVHGFGFKKIIAIVPGGKERYHSVYRGLGAASADTDYVFIHDGARPCLSREILKRNLETVCRHDSAVTAMPVKDTIKITDAEGFVQQTPDRSRTWMIQTPQTFSFPMIKSFYEKMIRMEEKGEMPEIPITDDAMVMETFSDKKVKLVEGAYTNIKVTTPEDLEIAQKFLQS